MAHPKIKFPSKIDATALEKKCGRLLKNALKKEGVFASLTYIQSQLKDENQNPFDRSYALRLQKLNKLLPETNEKIEKLKGVFCADDRSAVILAECGTEIDKFREALARALVSYDKTRAILLLYVNAVLDACRTAAGATERFQKAWGEVTRSASLNDLMIVLGFGSRCLSEVEVLFNRLEHVDKFYSEIGVKSRERKKKEGFTIIFEFYSLKCKTLVVEKIEKKKLLFGDGKESRLHAEAMAVRWFLGTDIGSRKTVCDLDAWNKDLVEEFTFKRGLLV